MDGYNPYRAARVAETLEDFRNLQYYISSAPTEPVNTDDYYTEGWAALRQCALDGQRILECSAETSVPRASGGAAEQEKAELKQVLLDAYARRHEGQKIFLRQSAAQRWIDLRDQILNGHRPSSKHTRDLRNCDQRLRSELVLITDEYVYTELQGSDFSMGRWIDEDPSLRRVTRWLSSRM